MLHPLEKIYEDTLFRRVPQERIVKTIDLGDDTVVSFPTKKKAEIIGSAPTVLQAVRLLMKRGYGVTDTGTAWDETVAPRKRVTFAKLSK